jgi:cellulose biosynthesis protein BcsQ
MNTKHLLKLAEKVGDVKAIFRFPYVHIICISHRFTNLEQDERELEFCKIADISVEELQKFPRKSLLLLRLLTDYEFSKEYPKNSNRGHHWLSALINHELKTPDSIKQRAKGIKIIHFYSYKGGQARSTLVGLLSADLAKSGWKVLVVDSDIEAPSLDTLYTPACLSLAGTLLGIIQFISDIVPQRVKSFEKGDGYVDLLACRPESPEFDIDASAFALRCALEPMIIEDAARRIEQYSTGEKYDALLIDHGSGLSPVTLSWMSTLPAPIVVCVRLDEQWRPAEQFIKSVFRTNSTNPGVFVSWNPHDEDLESYQQRNREEINSLLDILSETISEADKMSPGELEDHWIAWSYDPAFKQSRLPDEKQLSPSSTKFLSKLRKLLKVHQSKLGKNS